MFAPSLALDTDEELVDAVIEVLAADFASATLDDLETAVANLVRTDPRCAGSRLASLDFGQPQIHDKIAAAINVLVEAGDASRNGDRIIPSPGFCEHHKVSNVSN